MEHDLFTAAIRALSVTLGPIWLVAWSTRKRYSFKLPLLLLCFISFAASLSQFSSRFPQDEALMKALLMGALPALAGWLYWRFTRDFWEKFDAEQAWPVKRRSG